jgi:hypothetical protein
MPPHVILARIGNVTAWNPGIGKQPQRFCNFRETEIPDFPLRGKNNLGAEQEQKKKCQPP